MKGRGSYMDGVVLLVGVIFFILTAYLYISRESTESAKYSETVKDVRALLTSLEEIQKQMANQNRSFAEATMAFQTNLDTRLRAVETKTPPAVNLTMDKPIEVSMVYREKGAMLQPGEQRSTPPPKTTMPQKVEIKKLQKKIKSSLVERAGLTPKENN